MHLKQKKFVGRAILSAQFAISCTSPRLSPGNDRQPASAVRPIQRPLTLADFETALNRNQFSRISDLLAYLKREYADHLSFHIFMFHSASLQPGYYQHPRVIVYGRDASFIFTFNDKESDVLGEKRGADAIETLAFNQTTKSFSLKEFRFRDDSDFPKDFKGKPFIKSQVNPPKCLSCHTGSTEPLTLIRNGIRFNPKVHPVWDPYPEWRGAYGGNNDILFNKQTGNPSIYASHPTEEDRQWDQFNRQPNGNRWMGRYSHLPALSTDVPYTRPNGHLTELLSAKNFERIARQFSDSLLNNRRGAPTAFWRYRLLTPLTCMLTTGLGGIVPPNRAQISNRPGGDLQGYYYDARGFLKTILSLPDGLIHRIETFWPRFYRNAVSEKIQIMDEMLAYQGQNAGSFAMEARKYKEELAGRSSAYLSESSLKIGTSMVLAENLGMSYLDWSMSFRMRHLFGNGDGGRHKDFTTAMIQELVPKQEQDLFLQLLQPENDGHTPRLCEAILDRILLRR